MRDRAASTLRLQDDDDLDEEDDDLEDEDGDDEDEEGEDEEGGWQVANCVSASV